MYKCDVCDYEGEDVIAGRWIFYCPVHKQVDIDKTMENEINYDLDNGNLDYLLNDPDLAEIAEREL